VIQYRGLEPNPSGRRDVAQQNVTIARRAAITIASSTGIAPRLRRSAAFSPDQLHDQRAPAIVLYNAGDLRDVRMVQRSQHLRLALETRDTLRDAGGQRHENLGGEDYTCGRHTDDFVICA
jgi:hypothetical protein